MSRKVSTIICGFTAGLLLVSACGCDRVYRMLDKEGAQEKKLIGDALPFEQNDAIREVQELLKIYGYNPGAADGKLGLHTRNAVERFQKDNGLKPTRFIDTETWERLHVPVKKGLISEQEMNMTRIQETLQKSGFDPGTIDGKFGPKTKKAVKGFQKSRGLKVDGKIGFQTLFALAQAAS